MGTGNCASAPSCGRSASGGGANLGEKFLDDAFYMRRSVGQLFPGQCFLGQVLFWKVGGKRAESVR